MLNRLLTSTFLVVLIGFFAQDAYASHAMGADISYRCIGPDTYEITATFYRDCGGINAPPSFTVDVISPSGCGPSLTVTLNPDTAFIGGITYLSGDEISPLCPTAISECAGGSEPGSEIYIYQGIVTLPTQCTDWTIQFSECCRNDAIDNLTTPDLFDIYIESTINNTMGFCNNSVIFTQLPITYICAGETFNFNHGAVDIDGDSLSYTMIQPLDDAGVTIPYAFGYSLAVPMTTTTGTFGFDPVTGQMTFTPDVEQVGVIAVLVEEWRAGVLIGSTIRDIQIIVTTCTSGGSPGIDGGIAGLDGGVATDTNRIESCPGDTISFALNFSDPDSLEVLTITSNFELAVPGGNFSWSGTNPAVALFSWVTSPSDTGFYSFTVTVADDHCPIISSQTFAFEIDLISGTFATPPVDQFCPGGAPVPLVATGGTSFTWTPSAGLSNDTVANPFASPDTTTTYIVTSNLSSFCKNKDTVIIEIVPNFPWLTLPGDSICRFETTTIGVTPDPASGPYSYMWSPLAGVASPGSGITDVMPDITTDYIVTMENDTGCVAKDTIPVIVVGAVPQFNLVSDNSLVCPGIGAQLDLVPKCGTEDIIPCTSTETVDVGPGFLETGAQTMFKGGYDDARMQILYSAEDLKEAGFHGGTIDELGWFVNEKNSFGGYDNFRISLSCAGFTDLGTEFEAGTSTVFGPATVNTVTGWNTFTLDQPYNWDGESGLLVEICFDNPDGSFTADDKVYYTNTEYTSVLIDFNLTSTGCDLEDPAPSDNRPNLRVSFCNQDFNIYDIEWTPTIGLSDVTIQNPIADPPSGPQTYIVEVDDNGCKTTDTITLDVDVMDVDAGPDLSICGDDQVPINVVVTGSEPDGGFVWNWSPGVGLSDPFGQNPLANPATTTTYTVTTTNANGCVGTDEVTVVVNDFEAFVGPQDYICFGDSIQLQAGTGISYEWFPTTGLSCPDCEDPIATPDGTTTYNVIVTDAAGCSDTVSTTIFVNPLPYLDACCDTTLFQLETTDLAATSGVSWQWTPETGLDDPTAQFPIASPLETTTYTVALTDANGCVNTADVTVNVIELVDINIPTAFSPNGDGVNDILFVIDRGLSNLDNFSIYNRWGEVVFSTSDINEGWNGEHKGKPAEVGTYVAVIRATSLTGTVFSKNVNIQLVR